MEKAETLPELMEDSSNVRPAFGGGNSWGNGNNNYSGGNRGDSRGGDRGGYSNSSNSNSNFGKTPGTGGYNNGGYSSGKGNSHVGDPNSAKPGKIDFFLGNLPYKIEENDFVQWANTQGVKDIEVRFVIDKEQNAHKGFGFISIYDESKKDKVLSLNGKNFNGKALRINEAKSK
jgi:RNA recognition motif-containing protein